MTGSLSRQQAGELRWASVLFVDLADYTALTYSWDALDLRDMLSGTSSWLGASSVSTAVR